MANIALGLELDLHRREPLLLRWYRTHSSTIRGLLSLLIVGLAWEIAGRSGRWPLILAPILARIRYLRSISRTAQRSAVAACLGSSTTGRSRCGMSWYTDSSSIFGSMRMRRTFLGSAL